jgi:hypothetical protein
MALLTQEAGLQYLEVGCVLCRMRIPLSRFLALFR